MAHTWCVDVGEDDRICDIFNLAIDKSCCRPSANNRLSGSIQRLVLAGLSNLKFFKLGKVQVLLFNVTQPGSYLSPCDANDTS